MSWKKNLVIIGGGASGLFAAIHAALASNDMVNITVLERMDRVGKKILATGNGRCNFTNVNTSSLNFYGRNPKFTEYALSLYNVSETLEFFKKLGVFPKEEQLGKVYPYSDQAASVLDALRNEASRLNICIETEVEVKEIIKQKSGFKLITSKRPFLADKVIVSTGGCASPSLGSNGSGFKLFKSLGHTVTELNPALVQIKTDTEIVKGLQGIKFMGTATIFKDKNTLGCEYGEILFTSYGLSGPPIFQLSGVVARNKGCGVSLDFMPNYLYNEVLDILKERRKSLGHLTSESFLTGLLNKKVGNAIAKKSGIEKLSLNISKISDIQLKKMAALIKGLMFNIKGLNGFQNAQVTAGGLLTDEFNDKTMESVKVKGLYCTGEIFDIFGDCGGYNLQWAWSSGYTAAVSAVKEMLRNH